MDKDEIKKHEMVNQFFNPKFSKDVWRAEMMKMGSVLAIKPEPRYDKDGDELYESRVERKCYDDIFAQYGYVPEFLLMIRCQAVYGRSNTAAATFFRDSMGLKPIDESKINHTINNPYEDLSDEELEMLQRHRDEKKTEVVDIDTEQQ